MAATINWQVMRPATYVILARVDGADERRFPFFVVEGPMSAARRQPAEEDKGTDGV